MADEDIKKPLSGEPRSGDVSETSAAIKPSLEKEKLEAAMADDNGWGRLKTLSSVASAVVIPIVLLWVGNDFNRAIKERELQGKFVEMAVEILRGQPDKDTKGLRDWATQVLNKYSGVPFSEETRKELINTTPFPSVAAPSSPGARYEGRKDMGNVNPGDGERFIGRGYSMITGRNYYTKYSKLLGIDLVSKPDLAEQPRNAALILALTFKSDPYLTKQAASGDVVAARRAETGGLEGLGDVLEKYRLYKVALDATNGSSPRLQLPGIHDSQWITLHIPTILLALHQYGIEDKSVEAFALAAAAHDTSEGRVMKEGSSAENR